MNKSLEISRDQLASPNEKNVRQGLKRRKLAEMLIGLVLLSAMHASFAQSKFDEDSDDKSKSWEESAVQLPAPPQTGDLLPFYVSPTATQSFALDAKSLAIGTDGVVRYTLVSVSSEGAKNISYEGIRCASFERKTYAFGREDGSWSRSRQDKWEPIVRGAANRQYAALALDYFCSNLTVAGNEKQMLQRIKYKKTLTEDLRNQ